MPHWVQLLAWIAVWTASGTLLAAEPPTLSPKLNTGALQLVWPGGSNRWCLDSTLQLSSPVAWSLFQQVESSTTQIELPLTMDFSPQQFFRLRSVAAIAPRRSADWEVGEQELLSSLNAPDLAATLVLSNVMWGPGRVGSGALRFNGGAYAGDGSRAWVSNPGHGVLPPPGEPFSLTFWLNPDSLELGRSGLAGNDPSGSNSWSLVLSTLGPGTNRIEFSGGVAPPGVTVSAVLLPGQWYSVAFRHDGTRGAIFLNGECLGSAAFPVGTHEGPIFFGGNIAGHRSFRGRLDQIRTYTYALSGEELSLAAHWEFDVSAGDIVPDRSLNQHAANLTSAAGWVPGKRGSALDIRVATMNVPNLYHAVLPPTGRPFSLTFWLQPRTLQAGRNGLMSFGREGTNGWELSLDVDPQAITALRFCSTTRGGTLDLRAPLDWSTDEWVQIAITHDGAKAVAYANGRRLQEAHGAIRSSRSPLIVGEVPGTARFAGAIDDLKVYSRALLAADVAPVASPVWEMACINQTTNLQLNGSGPAGKPLTYTLTSQPSKGRAVLHPATGVLSYMAGAQKGPDLLHYTVSDGEFTSEPSTINVSVVQPHWLAPEGGVEEPKDGSSPERAWAAPNADALDAIYRTNAYYDCFFYAPGIYRTRGWKYQERSTANPGCKHIGAGDSGPQATTIQLVDIWGAWDEELIFGPGNYGSPCDGFEVHNLVLDCNGNNIPKLNEGEPVWIRVPLERAGRVETLTLHWNSSTILYNALRSVGRAREFTISTRVNGLITAVTNFTSLSGNGNVDVITLGAEADEIQVELTRRAEGVEFYGLNEVEVVGPSLSLPTARRADGQESRLATQYSILSAVDGDGSSAWVSGSEDYVELEFPLPPGTRVSGMDLQWHCKTDSTFGRFGPAAGLRFRARSPVTGLFEELPFVRHERAPEGWETSTFGTDAANGVVTDRVQIILTARELMIDRYGLKEARFRSGNRVFRGPVPSALNALNFGGSRPILRAFDRDYGTSWASGTQGGVSAISLAGSNLKFTRLRIQGFGTRAGRECFPFYLISPRGQGGNVLVEDCLWTQPATNNGDGVTAVTMIQAPPDTLTNAVIRRCRAEDLKNHFTYSHGFTAIHVEDSVVDGASFGAYFEPDAQTDDIGAVLIRSNRFLNVDHGIFVLFHPGRKFDSLTCVGNEIVLSGLKAGAGIACCDTCSGGLSGTVTNLIAMHNLIRYPDWVERSSARDTGLFYSDIQNAVFGNNVVVQGNGNGFRVRQFPAGTVLPNGPPEACDQTVFPPPPEAITLPAMDTLLPGYRRAWFNNRNLSGLLLPVRTVWYGMDQAASEQQWPD